MLWRSGSPRSGTRHVNSKNASRMCSCANYEPHMWPHALAAGPGDPRKRARQCTRHVARAQGNDG